jgi:WD40 repeat protein
VYFAKLVESKIVIAGTSAGSNTLTIYDPASGAETIVIDAANEIEVYSVTYSPGQRTLVFSGLRFSDNSIVTGEIAMP